MVIVVLPGSVCCQLRGGWCIIFEEGVSSSSEVVCRPLGPTIATGRCYNIPIASIYYCQHSDAVLYVVAVLWRRTIVIIRTGLVGGGGSNSLCDCSPVVDSTTWRLVHDRIINYDSIDMSCRVLDVVSHAKQTRRGLLY